MSRGAPLLLLLPALLAPAASAALPKESRWLEVRSAHFVLYGNATETRLRDVALSLERFQAVLASLTPGRTANAPLETAAYVFSDDEAFRPYKPLVRGKPADLDGFFQAGRERNLIALSARWNSDPRPIVYHELLHEFAANNFPPQPVWFQEGLAEYYSTFQADEKGATLGRAVGAHVRALRETAPDPIETILDATRESPEYTNPALRGRFYAESWALVHLLLHAQPPRTPRLFAYLRAVREGVPRAEAFRAFGTSEAELLSELVAYVRGSRFPYVQLRFETAMPVRTDLSAREMTRAEALAHLAELLESQGPERAREVEEHVGAALAASPCQAQALSLAARRHAREKRFDEARRLLREAEDADPLDPRIPFALGEVLLREAMGDEGPSTVRVFEARAAFRRSLSLDPWQPLVHAALGRTWFLERGGDLREGIFELEIAAERLPGRPDLAGDLAHLYRRAGDARRGEEMARLVLELEATRPDDAGDRRLSRGLEEVNRLLESRREEEAIELLARLAAKQPGELREELEKDLARMRATAGRNAEVRRYNDAIALLNAQQLERARAAFRALAAEAKDPQIARQSREHAERIEAFQKRSRRS